MARSGGWSKIRTPYPLIAYSNTFLTPDADHRRSQNIHQDSFSTLYGLKMKIGQGHASRMVKTASTQNLAVASRDAAQKLLLFDSSCCVL